MHYFRDRLNITSIVKHTASSLCEGYPAKYRIVMDQYLGFVPAQVIVCIVLKNNTYHSSRAWRLKTYFLITFVHRKKTVAFAEEKCS